MEDNEESNQTETPNVQSESGREKYIPPCFPTLRIFRGSKDNVERFMRRFEIIASASNWNELDQAKYLPLFVSNNILDVLETSGVNLYEPTVDSLKMMKDILKRFYSTDEHTYPSLLVAFTQDKIDLYNSGPSRNFHDRYGFY